MVKKIIIDTDPGIDDAMAIFLALRSPEIQLMGLTTIFGNVDCDQSVLNALRLLETEGHGAVPVSKGSDVPLFISTIHYATHVHGKDGMGNTNPPMPRGKPIGISAAQFIVKTILDNPGEITLVPIGPLTNIALAIRLEPRIIKLIKEVVIMGGAATVPGNVTPVAEANIWHDPHAASIVFSAGLPLTMVGLDVTMKVIQTEACLNEIYKANNPATNLLSRIMPCYQDFYFKVLGSRDLYIHDPSAIAYVLDPSLFRVQKMPIFVETEGHCIGQTVPDYRNQWGNLPLTNVCIDVNASGVLGLIKDRLIK
ncbi:MAG: nucleoside hydrolase [Lentisphaerota bacterium]